MNKSTSNFSLEYREYILPQEFPVLVLAPKAPVTPNPFASQHTKYHFHNCIEIGICHSGEHNLLFENDVYHISPGMFFVLSPYTMHFMNRNSTPKDRDCEYLYIKPEELLQIFYPFGIPGEMLWFRNSEVPFIFSRDTHPTIYELLYQIISEYKAQQPNYKIIIRGLFLSLMTELTRELYVKPEEASMQAIHDISSISKTPVKTSDSIKYQNMSKILPALQLIHKNPAQNFKLLDLAKLCHMSTSGFCTLFSELMLISPNRYINKLRLQNACVLLQSTELPVLDISIEAGFSSLSNFYRIFKEYYHMSPLKWRNQKRTIRKKNYRHSPFLPQ